MSTPSVKLDYLSETKEQIRQSINNKGVSLNTDIPFANYPTYINRIQSGNLSAIMTNGSQYSSRIISIEGLITLANLSNVDISSVTSGTQMFNGSNLEYLDISGWDTSNITSSVRNFFSGMNDLVTVIWSIDLFPRCYNDYSTAGILTLDLSSCPLSHDSCLDLFNCLSTKQGAGLGLSETTKSYMSEEEIAIATDKGWTVA